MLKPKSSFFDPKNLSVFIMPAICAFAFIVLLIFYVFPKINSISELRQKNLENKRKLAQLKEKGNLLASLKDVIPGRIGILNSALPDSRQPTIIIGALRGLCKENGLTLLSFQFNPGVVSAEDSGQKDNAPRELEINVMVSGPKTSLVQFFEAVNRTMPLFSISRFEIAYKGSDVETTLVLKTYTFKAPPLPSGGQADISAISAEEEGVYQKLLTYSDYTKLPVGNTPPPETGKANPFEQR